MERNPFLEINGLSKNYAGVTALNNVNLFCERHSIHAVLGENGAGKSTLIKIIAGVVRADSGRILLEGREVSFPTPGDAARNGVVSVFQELSLIPDLSVADNIFITDPPRRGCFIDSRTQRRKAEELLARVGCGDINPRERCINLPLSRRQLVEIAKALGRNPKLLILDEATSALSASDVEKVFEILKGLRGQGLSILYITHRLHEIGMLADTCSVFRNGKRIDTFKQGAKSPDEIVQLMIGRSISQVYPKKPVLQKAMEPTLEVDGLRWEDRLQGISFAMGKGEIVGLGGLDGQGQRELLLALFGVMKNVRGTCKLNGQEMTIRSPAQAKDSRHRIAMIPEDRKTEGLHLQMSIRDNISMASLEQFARVSLIDRKKEKSKVNDMIGQLQIKVGSVHDKVTSLSGGNQQKVLIAKWLLTGARCLFLMDPTRGIDVGTKQELYLLLRRLADQGISILFYSTDYDELIGMCDRIIILYRGRIVRELQGGEITEHNIISASLNLAGTEAICSGR